jgi:SAM-dependent methyltransferase
VKDTSGLHFNHRFLLDAARALEPRGRYLDYGCGRGETVAVGEREGLDIYGCEAFYGGGSYESGAQFTGHLGERIRAMPDGRIPFADGSFDVVFHNMVGEHLPDMAAVLGEIRRVLKSSGLMLSVFPTREVWREGHCGVRFSADSRVGYRYLLAMRGIGRGHFHGDKTREEWARDFQRWLRDWCHYRTRAEVRHLYSNAGFTAEPYELQYIVGRLRSSGRSWAVPMARCAPRLAREVLRRLATDVILSRR